MRPSRRLRKKMRRPRGLRESTMAASEAAVREIAKILRKHVDQKTLQKVVDDLLEIRGDKSFRDTIETLAHELRAKL